MRLRSSQFVFLLLLVCSVRLGEEYATQFLAGAMYGLSSGVSATREAGATSAEIRTLVQPRPAPPAETLRLNSAARAAHRFAWTVRRPARESAAVASFTGLLRA